MIINVNDSYYIIILTRFGKNYLQKIKHFFKLFNLIKDFDILCSKNNIFVFKITTKICNKRKSEKDEFKIFEVIQYF